MGVLDDAQGFMRKIAARGLENQKMNPGDYMDEEGLLVCGVCKERRQNNITLPTVTADGQETTMTMKVVCSCRCERERGGGKTAGASSEGYGAGVQAEKGQPHG